MFVDGPIPLLKATTSALTLHKNLLRHIHLVNLVGIFNKVKALVGDFS